MSLTAADHAAFNIDWSEPTTNIDTPPDWAALKDAASAWRPAVATPVARRIDHTLGGMFDSVRKRIAYAISDCEVGASDEERVDTWNSCNLFDAFNRLGVLDLHDHCGRVIGVHQVALHRRCPISAGPRRIAVTSHAVPEARCANDLCCNSGRRHVRNDDARCS